MEECIIPIQCGKHFSLDLPLLIGLGRQPCVLLAGRAELVLCVSSHWMTAKLAVWKDVTAHSASGLMRHESEMAMQTFAHGGDLLPRASMNIKIISSLNTNNGRE